MSSQNESLMTTLSPAYHACPLRCLCDWSSNSCYSLTAASCVTGETRRTSIRNWRSASLPASLSVLSSLERRILCRTVKTNSLCVAYSMHEGLANIPSPQSVFIAVTICVPLAQCKFIGSRTVYEVRERPARMFTWSAFLVSEILIEIPWNMLGSSLFFSAGTGPLASTLLVPPFRTSFTVLCSRCTTPPLGRPSWRSLPTQSSHPRCSVSCSRLCSSCTCHSLFA